MFSSSAYRFGFLQPDYELRMNEVQWQFSTQPEDPAHGSDFIPAYPDEQTEVFTEPEVSDASDLPDLGRASTITNAGSLR